MTDVSGALVVHLGGWRGDRLSLSRDAGEFETLADLGWDERRQTTPQRRMVLEGGKIFVLEPVEGALLAPPVRVRRFDLSGRETGAETDEVEGEADLYYRARRAAEGVAMIRLGIDRSSGRPVRWEGTFKTPLVRRGQIQHTSGTPLLAEGRWWFPFVLEGLQCGEQVWRGDPGPLSVLLGRVVCPGHGRSGPGAWVDGRWRPVEGARLFPPGRPPRSPAAASWGDEGTVLLRREGGELPVLDGPPARLPPGIYTALAEVSGRVFALAEGDDPRLVPVEL